MGHQVGRTEGRSDVLAGGSLFNARS